MEKIELIIVAFCAVWTAIMGFDFIAYAVKTGAKSAVFSLLSWRIALLTASALIYWLMNGQKFI